MVNDISNECVRNNTLNMHYIIYMSSWEVVAVAVAHLSPSTHTQHNIEHTVVVGFPASL